MPKGQVYSAALRYSCLDWPVDMYRDDLAHIVRLLLCGYLDLAQKITPKQNSKDQRVNY